MDHILQYSSLTPLQKARRALRLALNKAAEDIILHNPSYPSCSFKFDCDGEFQSAAVTLKHFSLGRIEYWDTF